MNSEVVSYQGRSVTLQAPDSSTLVELRAAAQAGGLAALLQGVSLTARALVVAVDVVTTSIYRIRVVVENRQIEFDIQRILGLYAAFDRGRQAVNSANWDADLKARAYADLDRALERRRR